MIRTMILSLLCLFATSCVRGPNRSTTAVPPRLDPAYDWYSLPLTVYNTPTSASWVPVSCPVDLAALLNRAGATGPADEHSLRFYEVQPNGAEVEQPAQYTPVPQPRAKPATGASSRPAVPPANLVRQVGELSWAVGPGQGTTRRYLLRIGVPRKSRMLQVPFPPQNLRAFDENTRATPPSYFPAMQIHPQWPAGGVVHLSNDRELITSYHVGPTTRNVAAGATRRPFFYPVIGPDGVPLTEFGKPHDPTGSHAHHYSLWIAHNDVDGHEFWSEKGGAIVHEQLELMEDGPVFSRLVQRARWVFAGADVLRERRQITVYNTPADFRVIDIELDLSPAGNAPVTLGKTTFGFLAARVAQSMTVFDGGGEIRNSHGDLNEQNVHLKHADWLDQSGPTAPGKWGGIAIFDHPANINHPTMWHCRNDGWAGAAFNGEAAYEIEPAKPLHLRYRVLLHRGDASAGNVARQYEVYSAQPRVDLGDVSGRR